MMHEAFSDMVVVEDGITCLKPCWSLCLLFDGTIDQHEAAFRRAYGIALDWFGDELAYQQTDLMKKPRRLKDRSREQLESLLVVDERAPHIFKLFLESESAAKTAPDYGMTVYSLGLRDACALRLSVPVGEVLGSEDRAVERVRHMVRGAEISSGYAGFGISTAAESPLAAWVKRKEWNVSHRWLGVDTGDVLQALYAVPGGFKCVNWLTLLGQRWLTALGGEERLRQQLDASIDVESTGDGVLIRACRQPLLGDIQSGEAPAPYRAVGRVLAPVRSRSHPPFLFPRASSTDDGGWSQQWLARFDS